MKSNRVDPKWQDLVRYTKDTNPYLLKFKKNKIITDITGWTIYFTLKEKYSDTDTEALINKTITSHSDPTNGETLITFTVAECSLVGNYHYSIEYATDEGDEGVIVIGKMEFKAKPRTTRE